MNKIVKNILKIAAAVSLSGMVLSCGQNSSNSKKTIDVLSREDGSGTRGAFIELFNIEEKNSDGVKVDNTTDEATITNSTAVMITSIQKNKNAIGYISLGSLDDSVKALKIDGAEANVQNIINDSYKISRSFNIVLYEDLSAQAKDFVDFILSESGQNIIQSNKYIKIKNSPEPYKNSTLNGKIKISGSSSVYPVMEKLVEKYSAINPSIQIELQQSDSTTGIKDAIDKKCDIGMSSRELKSSELKTGVKSVTIAKDGIAVIVNKENPLNDASKSLIKEIFTGKVSTWSF